MSHISDEHRHGCNVLKRSSRPLHISSNITEDEIRLRFDIAAADDVAIIVKRYQPCNKNLITADETVRPQTWRRFVDSLNDYPSDD